MSQCAEALTAALPLFQASLWGILSAILRSLEKFRNLDVESRKDPGFQFYVFNSVMPFLRTFFGSHFNYSRAAVASQAITFQLAHELGMWLSQNVVDGGLGGQRVHLALSELIRHLPNKEAPALSSGGGHALATSGMHGLMASGSHSISGNSLLLQPAVGSAQVHLPTFAYPRRQAHFNTDHTHTHAHTHTHTHTHTLSLFAEHWNSRALPPWP